MKYSKHLQNNPITKWLYLIHILHSRGCPWCSRKSNIWKMQGPGHDCRFMKLGVKSFYKQGTGIYEWWLLSSSGKMCLVWIFILIFLARATKQSESMVMVGSEMDGWGLEQRGLGGWWCGAGGGSQNTGAGASALRGLPPAPPLHRGSGSPRKKGRILKETFN